MKKSILTFLSFLYLISCIYSQSWTSFTTANSDIPFDKIHSLDISPSGEIWIGNDVSGSYNHVANFNGVSWSGHIPSSWVNDLQTDNYGKLWTSVAGELRCWDGQVWSSFTPPNNTLGWWAGPVCAGSNNLVWILDYSNLWKFDGVTWELFTTSNSDLPSTSISMMYNNNDILYLATSDEGLVYYENGIWMAYNTSNSNIPSNAVLAVNIHNDVIWVVCQTGDIAMLDNGNFISHSFPALNTTKDLAVDDFGNAWIAGYGSGIIKFDGTNFTVYDNSTSSIMDPYNQYMNIEVDDLNNVWVGSRSAGLLKLSQNSNPDSEINPNDTIDIFFLGNSFTAANDMPNMVLELVNAAGLPCYILTHAPGGQFCTDHCVDPFVYETIKSHHWDYVVIQDNQGAFVNSPPYVSSNYMNANTQLYDSIKANDICTSVIWFAGWAAEGGYPAYFPGDNSQSCIQRILDNVVYMNNTMGEVVGPIGEGWIRSLNEHPAIDLYSSDGTHPSNEGSFLTASVLFSLMFKYNPTNLNYDAGINSIDAAYLRQIGYEVVSNQTNQVEFNITSITPEIVIDMNQLSLSQAYNAHQWLFANDILNGENSACLNYIDQGVYAAYVLNNNYCQLRSFDQEFGPLTTSLFSYSENNGTVTFSNLSLNSTSWEWDFGDGTSSVEENPVHTYNTSGIFTVMLTSTGSSGMADYSDQISISLSIERPDITKNFSVFPNPCYEILSIINNKAEEVISIEIFDSSGRLARTINTNLSSRSSIKINTNDMTTGKYYISIKTKNANYIEPLVVR